MSSLKINNLSKSFGSTTVINNISFEVKRGEFCILLGPSGCGKSTVLRLIAGLEQQDAGEIFIGGKEVSNLTPKQRDIAMVFQSYALYPHMNVFDNMAFSMKMQKTRKEAIDKRVNETAVLLDLVDYLDRKPGELSGGQRQRVAIGRAIVRNPQLFLFDEPLSNLDAKLRSSMRVELAGLHRKLNSTTMYVTHDQVEAMTLGEKIILLDKGAVQQIGTPDEMYNKPANTFVATFIGTPQINLIEGSINISNEFAAFESEEIIADIRVDNKLKQYAGRKLTIGIRPEALTPGDGPIKGRLELIEHLGPETLVYIRSENTILIAKAPAGFREKQGAEISLTPGQQAIHYFINGKRIAID